MDSWYIHKCDIIYTHKKTHPSVCQHTPIILLNTFINKHECTLKNIPRYMVLHIWATRKSSWLATHKHSFYEWDIILSPKFLFVWDWRFSQCRIVKLYSPVRREAVLFCKHVPTLQGNPSTKVHCTIHWNIIMLASVGVFFFNYIYQMPRLYTFNLYDDNCGLWIGGQCGKKKTQSDFKVLSAYRHWEKPQ